MNKSTCQIPVILNEKHWKDNSFIYARSAKFLNLDGVEYRPDFLLNNALDTDAINLLCKIYLYSLEHTNKAKQESLKENDSFEVSKLLKSLYTDLKSDFSENRQILEAFSHHYTKLNPNALSQSISQPYFKNFFDALNLNEPSRILFYTVLLNNWEGWIYNPRDNAYSSRIFASLFDEKPGSPTDFARKTNNVLIELGLFKSPWCLQDFVISFFTGGLKSLELKFTQNDVPVDFYNYDEVFEANSKELSTALKLTRAYVNKGQGLWLHMSGTEDYRCKEVLTHYFKNHNLKVYELNQIYPGASALELEFNLLALSQTIKDENAVIYLDQSVSSKLFLSKEASDNCAYGLKSLLDSVKVPVFFYTNTPKQVLDSEMLKKGIKSVYSVNLNVSDLSIQKELIPEHFCYLGNPANLKTVVDTIFERKIQPSEWQNISRLTANSDSLSKEEVQDILDKDYPQEYDPFIRKNSHYSFEALEMTMEMEELQELVQNAKSLLQKHYDNETGTKFFLYGPSGTGKTAVVEQLSKKVGMKLKILKYSDLVDKYVGETEKTIAREFQQAAREKAILLLDECDSLMNSRENTRNNYETSKINELLQQIEHYPSILFCCTNLPESIDNAFSRRLHYHIGFKPLSKSGVKILCNTYFQDIKFKTSQINEIFNSGDVCPGDFGVMNQRLRLMNPEKINAAAITKNLCEIVMAKKRTSDRKIGFDI